MQNRAKSTMQNVGDQIVVTTKNAAKTVGNQFSHLTQQDTPNYAVSTAASILFGSIYVMSSDDAHIATTLAFLGFATSTYMAVKQYGVQNTYDSAAQMAKNAYQAASSKMITLFKSYIPGSHTGTVQEPADQIELRTRKRV